VILTLQSTTFGVHGGIPTYNRMVCRALSHVRDRLAIEQNVLLATDTESEAREAVHTFPGLHIEAFGGNRAAFVRRAISIALRGRIDLLLVGHINYAPLALVLKRLRPSMRFGVMVHGVEVWKRLPITKRRALQRADFITAVSEYTKAKVVELNEVPPERVHILPNTIEWTQTGTQRRGNEEALRTSESDTSLSGLLKKRTVLLSVCRLDAKEKYKGVDTVIEALPAVVTRFPDVQYVVIGSGSDLERHRRLALKNGVAARVHFLGSVDDATLRECYRACDVFVLPSDGEGFGIVYLEAMHYGKPVIAANSRAVPEVVKHDETGLLVDYGNVEQLAEAISALCLNVSLREKLGRAGRDKLERDFSFDLFKRKLHEIVLSGMPATVPKPRRVAARGVAGTDG
jgi:phosphatidylinositol alpha-1,6-mannosyltransferase